MKDPVRCLTTTIVLALVLGGGLAPRPARAGLFDPPAFIPRVPVSPLARPAAWFDPSRLHVSSLVSVGSGGFRGGDLGALQVTSLSYGFKAPVRMSVSVGNAWGAGRGDARSSFFLEGFNVLYRPSASMFFQVQYRDIRSPLQLGPSGYGYWTP